jgi:hypothetical protein
MRVSNDRYSRDLRSIDLARRMLEHEARTQTIRAWTGLTGERVRNLARSRGSEADCAARRLRGPSPSCLRVLLGTARARQEAAAAAGLCRALQVLPEKPTPDARIALPGLVRGERLLAAFEIFREVIPQARLTLEQLVFLVLAVAEGKSCRVDHCTRCHATILMDRLAPRVLCGCCGSEEESQVVAPSLPLSELPTELEPEAPCLQQRLFD